ncbi:hypothetical protein BDA96_10G348300 [Sorghum bicolor]|nr:GDSL esterase/lipase At5g55050-like isoform X2 [Sorghum bicolor]XP_021304752.1 GDSL esterase/lipase At5g55050-like isoform X2 [Sorghum bicolor]XP_021304753.1 GDSL esterase/lipase At5g55050-like isoform X2 [Sorghum bicolor]KAG0516278.1 hypothetical protein BDA96_10G348300 [Sorghum bicolor]KXG20915.1 hypothetical protein SORBI_3010G270900 [Sorghum bicolor]|eukprot:XP_021304751.1 GDSL esterase/lipase At5g55050-like isoform X2 [Sorghum bicolor]
MYVFGDSTLDVGNNNYLPGTNVPRANRPYYGVDFPGGVPTGRFSNGYNTADFIAKCIGFVSSPPPYLSLVAPPASSGGLLVPTALTIGVSYASGGAGILDSTNAGSTIPLSKQVQYFNATRSKMIAAAAGSSDALINKSIFLLLFGGNDLFAFANAEQAQNRSGADLESDTAAFYGSLVSNYSAAIRSLYALGARRLAVVNVGLAGCLPVARLLDATGACAEDRNRLAAGFNAALRSLLADDLAASSSSGLPGLAYSLADSLGLMADTFADPRASGFVDVADACCGGGRLGAEATCAPNATLCADRGQYYFWDNVHPTERAAALRAHAFYDGPAQYTTPINFKQLVHMS